jgi:hypothetical protein
MTTSQCDVRFTKAVMCSAIRDVRYVPIADKPSLAANWRSGVVMAKFSNDSASPCHRITRRAVTHHRAPAFSMIDEADDAPLLKLVAIQGNVWCAGHVIACTALHEIQLVRMPE